jgi:hypothetical protein
MTFDQWWYKETEAVGRKGMGRNSLFYQLAKRAWVAAEEGARNAIRTSQAELCHNWRNHA